MERLFRKFKENWGLRKEIEAFNNYLKNPHWILIPEVSKTYSTLSASEVGDCIRRYFEEKVKSKKCIMLIFKSLKKSFKAQSLEQFNCDKNIYGIIYPLFDDKKVVGFIVLCGLTKPMSLDVQKIFIAFTHAVLRESRKEIELEEKEMKIEEIKEYIPRMDQEHFGDLDYWTGKRLYELRKKFPRMGYRKMEEMTGIKKSTVQDRIKKYLDTI